jgi:hypothetical protein
LSISKPWIREIKRRIKITKIESIINIASEMTNTIKAAFLARIAVLWSLL